MEEGKRPRLNPLDVPWGKKPKTEPKSEEKVPSFIGVRNEAVRDSVAAEKTVTIEVRGVQGFPNGEYRVEWVEGNNLQRYLSRLKLLALASRAAIRDTTNMGAGRLRMHYIPAPGAKIVLGNPAVSSALQFQRTNYNAENVALKMGGGERFVDVPLPGRK